MAANKLLSTISILGLSVGIATAILMGLVVRNQMTFDAYLPLEDRTYLAVSPPNPKFPNQVWHDTSDYGTAYLLKDAPGVESVARLLLNNSHQLMIPGNYRNLEAHQPMMLKQGNITGFDLFYWADPNIFDVLRFPVLHGDLAHALARPDGIVLSRSVAEKYFGDDDVVGRILTLDDHPMVVRAVIRDLPTNATTFQSGIFVSGTAPFSELTPLGYSREKLFDHRGNYEIDNRTYLRLKPGANISNIESIAAAYYKPIQLETETTQIRLTPLADVNTFEPLNPGIRTRLLAAGIAGLLVLFISAVNFVNLMVARSARREREVGVRKSLGAGRQALMVQFLGEAMIAVILAVCIAMVLSEWLLPAMNAFLDTGASLNYVGDPGLTLALFLGIMALGLAVGAYPSFLLSSLKPTSVLRGWTRFAGQNIGIRNILMTFQFAILIVLAISAWVMWQQHKYAMQEALRVDADQMLIVQLDENNAPKQRPAVAYICSSAFETELRNLAGVRDVECSDRSFLSVIPITFSDSDRDHILFKIGENSISSNLLQLYGIKPLAGSLYDRTGTVINSTAVRKLGFASPQAAIGKNWISSIPNSPERRDMIRNQGPHNIITAVVPDFALTPVTKPFQATIYSQWSPEDIGGQLVHIKLDGQMIPETLTAIDHLWTATRQEGPIIRFFLNDYLQQEYLDMTRETALLAIFTSLAISLASLGLMGIAVSTAERRTKEIGIRKTMGATTAEVAALLLWQFAQPVLWANVIAWPAAWWLMRRWLSGFAYHVDLHWWVFAAASVSALIIALLTVGGQAFLTARQKPVLALRYE